MRSDSAPIRGIIEGFYGTPWTWDERIAVSRYCADRGMTHYVYAPKDDPKHRLRWREPYTQSKLDGFSRLLAEGGLTVGFAISPGLDIDPADAADRAALRAKVDQVVDLGVTLVMLALDDIPFDSGAGSIHAGVASELQEHLAGRATLTLVPTEYVGMEQTPYLTALAAGLPTEIPIGWTGPSVVNDVITAEQAKRRAEALDGRPPLLWDNYPVNDALMVDRLFMGPLWGRDADLMKHCGGYLANAMVQPRCSLLPLASIAGWLRGEDPLATWEAEAGALRVFAEACDGAVPRALAQQVTDSLGGPDWPTALQQAAGWLDLAAACEAPGLEGEADAWLAQVHREAKLGLSALRLIQAGRPFVSVDAEGCGTAFAPQPEVVTQEAFAIGARWPKVRRGEQTVMGARCSFRPVLGQAADGSWRVARSAVAENQNAIDTIVRAALDGLDDLLDAPGGDADHGLAPVEVTVDDESIAVGEDGTFVVATGVTVESAVGAARTAQKAPCGPPVPTQ